MRARHVVGLAVLAASFVSSVSLASGSGAPSASGAGVPPAPPPPPPTAAIQRAAMGGAARPAQTAREARAARLGYVPGELLVQFRRGVDATRRARVVRGAGCVVEQVLPGTAGPPGRTTLLVQSSRVGTAVLAEQLSADPAVAAVSPNYLRRLDAVPLDEPGLSLQWGLPAVNAPDAWEITTGSADVVVASIDTGVDVLHPDLAANIWRNPGEVAGNGLDDDANGYVDDVYGIDAINDDVYPLDDYGHGTHTSGIMAAVGDNAIGIAGVSWRTKVMALKFISWWDWGTDVGAIECIDYVIDQKVDHGVNVVAINASWGGPESDLLLRNTIKAAGDAGIVFCASAGNEHTNADLWGHYPASYDCPNILAVCASDGERLASFSNWGVCTTDLAAPGANILSTFPGGDYVSWGGTSMAAPFVTGTVALCAARHPGETAYERVDRIMASVRPKRWLEGLCMSGGLVDAAAALGLADPATDVTAPTTTALGLPDHPSDVSLIVNLYPADGPGGSGVASTQWRVDGGRWKEGTRALVSAPTGVVRTRSLDFRSVDRAGNAEDVRTISVTFDTTTNADDDIPGVRLPASPVTGTTGWPDETDVFRLRLEAGETLRLTLADPLRATFDVTLYRAGTTATDVRRVRVWRPTERRTLTYKAPATDRYYLAVGSSGYAFDYSIAPPDVDVIPPTVIVDESISGWSNVPVTLAFTVRDVGGSGAGASEVSVDEGLSWAPAQQLVVDAPADHGNDGVHRVLVRGSDVAGNVSDVVWREVFIDTEGPATQAWGPVDPVRHGGWVVARFKVSDRAEAVFCTMVVRSARTGKVVLREDLGRVDLLDVMPRRDPDPESEMLRHAWRCWLPAGDYNVFIAGATHDPAGNLWSRATCERRLTVE